MDFSNPRDMDIADPIDERGLRKLRYDKNWYSNTNKGRLNTCTLGIVNLTMFLFAIWLIDQSIVSQRSEEIKEYYDSLKRWKG